MSERIFTADLFSHLISLWRFVIIPLIPKGPVRCLEIGSYEGKASSWILDSIVKNHSDSRLDCVDLWRGLEEQERLFDTNLASELQVTKCKDFSVNFLAPLVTQPPMYDFIYVDGDHRGEVLFTDLCLAWRCLKKKGVMAVVHYLPDGIENSDVPSPRVAIDSFLKIHKSEIRLLEKSRHLIVQKRAVPLCGQE